MLLLQNLFPHVQYLYIPTNVPQDKLRFGLVMLLEALTIPPPVLLPSALHFGLINAHENIIL